MPRVAVTWEARFEPVSLLESDDPRMLARYKGADLVDLSPQFIARFEAATKEMEEVWNLLKVAIRAQEDDGA